MRKCILIVAMLFIVMISRAQVDLQKLLYHPWVDSVYQSLTAEQRIGQLVWIDVTAKNNLNKQLKDADLIKKYGIMATAKHYPGHGDTQTDSHLMLPLLPYPRQRLDSLELYPFRKLSDAGIGCIMTAHLHVPGLDSSKAIPSSLSPLIIDQILHKNWQFKGLVITDAMNMNGAKGYENPGRLEVLALKAGNDVIEFPADPELAIKAIMEAVKSKELSQDEINLKCRKVLAAKLWCGLNRRQVVETDDLITELNSPHAELIKRKIIESSLTLLNNRQGIIPVSHLESTRIASVSVGNENITPFQKMLSKYTKVDHFQLSQNFTESERLDLQKKLQAYDLVIAGIHSMYESKHRHSLQVGSLRKAPPTRPYGVTDQLDSLMTFISAKQKSIAVIFASPYGMGELHAPLQSDGLLLAFQNDTLVQELSAQLIFGGIGANGTLPVSVPGRFKSGDGIRLASTIRLKYTIPEEVGIVSKKLNYQIDSIVGQALDKKAFPGCNVLVAKDGKVIFHRAYGYHAYDQIISEQEDDLYDLASVTKITAGLPAWMKLYDEGKVDPDQKISAYYREWKNRLFHRSDKADITVRELLAHQSGLTPFIPFWKESLKDGKTSSRWYTFEPDQQHNLQVARGLYLDNRFPDKVFKNIRKSALKSRGSYVYSDLPFVLTPKITSGISGQSFAEGLDNYFYKPLGAYRITYNPLLKFPENEIIPTELDDYYRRQQLLGTVHDESSATLGGISGNAGLFASANDLAKLLQMYLQMGSYGGVQYLKESTLKEFTRVQFPQNKNRRGMGFDKPSLNNSVLNEKEAYPIKAASPESFGHSGYTGTFVWIDPKYGLVYIFLSNRVFPTRNNNKISDLNVRTEIQHIIYRNMTDK